MIHHLDVLPGNIKRRDNTGVSYRCVIRE